MRADYAFGRRSRKQRRKRFSFRGFPEALEQRLAPATFVVNSIYDQPAVDPTRDATTAVGSITLRSAIQAANVHPNDNTGPDRVEFNIPGIDVHTIVPYSVWPTITDPVVIDGYTQPRAKANTLDVGDDVILKINLNDQFGFGGLTITAGNSTVRGLDFTHFDHALTLTEKGGNVVAGNFFGLPASGGVSLGNNIALYVGLGADGNTIGGTSPADRNVISGNGTGVRIVASSNNVVQGNYIGVEPNGGEPLGNGQGDVIVTSGVAGETIGPATGNLIGGTVAGARNVISGSGGGVIFGGDRASLVTGNLVQGNYIGTDAVGNGNAHLHNNGPGVLLGSGTGPTPDGVGMNTIGGSTAAARNIIANSNDGIVVGTDATDNLIQGNYIGTEVTGTATFGNSVAGIAVHGKRTTILDNLVSGNRDYGILIQGGDESLIQGNLIGTNAAGTASVQNQWGVLLSGSNHVTIGGTTAGARNVISGNQRFGVSLEDFGVGNRVQGNFIGTDINGTGALGNSVDGIFINYSASPSPSGDTVIGGPDPGAGNAIAFNAYNGVHISNSTQINQLDGSIESNTIFSNGINGILCATLNARDPHYRITRNSIYSNGHLGIDLATYDGVSPNGDGVTPNDSRGHVGPNNFQNFPLLTSVTTSDTATHVSGTLHSTPNSTFRIEFFANADADPSGHGEGQTFLGFTNVTTDASGNSSFSDVVLPPAPAGQTSVAATATDPNGNTSEFSTTVAVDPAQASADLAVSMDVAPSQVEPGGNVTYAITVTNNGPTAADNVTLSTGVPASTTFVSFTAPSGWTSATPSAGGAGNVTGSVARVDSGESATMTFVVHVNANTPRATALSAIATVTSDTADPNTSNNTIFATATVPGSITQTDLAIAASVVPESVPQGQPLTFSFIVSNNGQIAATNVILALETPSQTTFQSVAAPSGWTTQSPSVGGTGILGASIPSIDAGTSAVFTVTVNVNSTATVGSTITAQATIASETIESNQGNNRAEASATVVEAAQPAVAAGVTVAISGDINPATVGQAVTYTISVTNPGGAAATGAAAHVSVPNDVTIVSQGGGSHTSSGIDFGVGSLGAGETRQFRIVLRPVNTGTLTLTASATADPDVTLGPPASVTTTVVGAAPGETPPPTGETPPPTGETPPPTGETPPPTGETPPPTVLSAVRYGFHRQATVLVVTFDKDMNPSNATNHGNYVVLVSANGTDRSVPISKVWYNVQTHQSTLRVAGHIYLFRPWRLVVRGDLTDMTGVRLSSDGVAGHSFVAQMDSHSLNGPSWDAPQASRVGVKAVPAGPLATWAEKVARTVRTQPIRTTAVLGAHRSAKALNARPPADQKVRESAGALHRGPRFLTR